MFKRLTATIALLSAAFIGTACGGGGGGGTPNPPPGPTPTPPLACNHTGVTSVGGVNHFAQLHVSGSGRIVDGTGCEVYLLGTNDASPFLGSGGTMGAGWGSVVQALHTNLSRVGISTRWWNENINVPTQGMHYQDWIVHIVHTLESDGLYVELDATTNFWENPCPDPGGSDCPSQDQGEVDYKGAIGSGNQQQIAYYYQGLAVYTPVSITALTSLAQSFGSDPAIIFDVWNEPADYAFTMLAPNDPNGSNNYLSNMNQRIATINSLAPSSLVVVYDKDDTMMNNGQFYTGTNIVVDVHMYTRSFSFSNGIPSWITWAQNNHAGAIVNEYGGTPPSKSDPGWQQFDTYVTAIYAMGEAAHAGVAYFHGGDLTQSGFQQLPLNDAGNLVASLTQTYFSQ